MLADDVITRLKAQVSDLATRTYGAADLSALLHKGRLPQHGPAAHVVPSGMSGDTTASHYIIRLLFADRTLVRVRALGLAAGPWVADSLGTLIPAMWSADDSAPMWST